MISDSSSSFSCLDDLASLSGKQGKKKRAHSFIDTEFFMDYTQKNSAKDKMLELDLRGGAGGRNSLEGSTNDEDNEEDREGKKKDGEEEMRSKQKKRKNQEVVAREEEQRKRNLFLLIPASSKAFLSFSLSSEKVFFLEESFYSSQIWYWTLADRMRKQRSKRRETNSNGIERRKNTFSMIKIFKKIS